MSASEAEKWAKVVPVIDAAISRLTAAGWTEDEIVDALAVDLGDVLTTPADRAQGIILANSLRVRNLVRKYVRNYLAEQNLNSSSPQRGIALTRGEIVEAQQAHLRDGPRSPAIHKRLGVSKSTLLRYRKRLGLVPWPKTTS